MDFARGPELGYLAGGRLREGGGLDRLGPTQRDSKQNPIRVGGKKTNKNM
jgi:hypothetical protein